MRKFCLGIKFPELVTKEEKNIHKRVISLRKSNKTYKDIADELNISISKIGYYLTSDPNKVWTLDDWIKDYLIKDSGIYSKVDFLIDPDQKLINRFKSKGIEGNCIEKII